MTLPRRSGGPRVLVTRAADQAEPLTRALDEAGLTPVLFPTVQIQPLEDLRPLDRALAHLSDYLWLGFTSANGVRVFHERLVATGRKGLPLAVRVAAVGRVTARALLQRGLPVHYVPPEFRGERLADGMGDVAGRRVLLPRAEEAREALVTELRRRGAMVDDLPVYRTVAAAPSDAARAELARGVAVATFTSASTVRHFAALAGGDAPRALAGAVVACIGPLTAEAARGLGLDVAIQPQEYTVEALVEAVRTHLADLIQPEYST